MVDSLSIAVHALTRRTLISLSVDETLLLSYVNLSTNFREPLFILIKFHVLRFICIHIEADAS